MIMVHHSYCIDQNNRNVNVPGLDGVCSGEGLQAGIHLDSGEKSVGLEEVNEGGALGAGLEEGLLVQDGARDVLAKSGGREEEA